MATRRRRVAAAVVVVATAMVMAARRPRRATAVSGPCIAQQLQQAARRPPHHRKHIQTENCHEQVGTTKRRKGERSAESRASPNYRGGGGRPSKYRNEPPTSDGATLPSVDIGREGAWRGDPPRLHLEGKCLTVLLLLRMLVGGVEGILLLLLTVPSARSGGRWIPSTEP